MMENFPSLRSFDEFVGNKATFKLPTTDNVNIRMKKNLLYYQTNYFVIIFSLSILFLFTHLFEAFSGLLCLTVCLACYHINITRFRHSEETALTRAYSQMSATIAGDDEQKRNIVNLVLVMLTCLMLFSYGKNMLLTLLIVCLSFLVCLVHAAFRRIDISNQFSSMKAQISKSPMYHLVAMLDSKAESYFGATR